MLAENSSEERVLDGVLRGAAGSFIVNTKSVAAKPSRTSTRTLPSQPLSRFSSVAIEPCPAIRRSPVIRSCAGRPALPPMEEC